MVFAFPKMPLILPSRQGELHKTIVPLALARCEIQRGKNCQKLIAGRIFGNASLGVPFLDNHKKGIICLLR